MLATLAPAAPPERYFPDATEVVVTINVRQLLQSPLIQKELGRARQELARHKEIQQTLDALGFDPFKDLDTLRLAGAGIADPDRALLVLEGRFDTAKFQSKANEVARAKGEFLKIHDEGGRPIYETNLPRQSKPLFVAVLDSTTLIASFKKSYIIDTLDIEVGKKTSTLRSNLRELLGKADPQQSVNILGMGSALTQGTFLADKVQYVAGGIKVGDDIRIDFTIATKDATAASELARLLREALDQGKNFLTLIAMNQKELAPLVEIIDMLKVSEHGSDVALEGRITKEFLEELKKKQ
jgi:hypothetical protein